GSGARAASVNHASSDSETPAEVVSLGPRRYTTRLRFGKRDWYGASAAHRSGEFTSNNEAPLSAITYARLSGLSMTCSGTGTCPNASAAWSRHTCSTLF